MGGGGGGGGWGMDKVVLECAGEVIYTNVVPPILFYADLPLATNFCVIWLIVSATQNKRAA